MYKMVLTFAPVDKKHRNHSDKGYCEYFNGMLFFYFTFNSNIEVWGRRWGGKMVQEGSNLQCKLKAICTSYGFRNLKPLVTKAISCFQRWRNFSKTSRRQRGKNRTWTHPCHKKLNPVNFFKTIIFAVAAPLRTWLHAWFCRSPHVLFSENSRHLCK